eukprot:TRINITY_DN2138_c0_g1_i13.p1 TRINITY_DN2138_c0_g1~~TRINITY_DN2138_c0_g1_i13.p1  ORF type:complete len:556 (+),score=161.63 TRINITY_DN2138_c0_g1_i13:71-1669(+)
MAAQTESVAVAAAPAPVDVITAAETEVITAAETEVITAAETEAVAAAAPPATVAATEKKVTTLAVPQRFQDLRLAVKDGFVYVQGRVDGVLFCVRTRADEVSDAVKERIMTAFQAVEAQLSKASEKARSAVVFVDTKAKAGAVRVQVQALELRDLASNKTHEGFTYVKDAAMRVPVPIKVKEGAFYVQTKTASGVVYFKDGCMRISSRVDNSVVHIKASTVRSYQAARNQAHGILATVSASVQRRNARLQDGLVLVKGKVDNVAVQVRSKAAAGRAGVEEALVRCKSAVDELRVTKALKNGATVVSSKVNGVTIYVKDGYVHIISKAGDGAVYVKAKLAETSEATRIKVVETYVAAETTIQAVLKRIVDRALATYQVTRVSTLAVADRAKAQADALSERSKAFANEKPITASTASGAALGGTGGGVAGLATGAVAGAAAGLPLALFTFGLSIPVGAVMGGSAGAAVGATVGTTAGAVGGGVVGYSYEHRDQINAGLDSAKVKAAACKDYVKETAVSSRAALAARLRRSAAGA